MVRFIADNYGARNLMQLPRKVGEQIFARPMDFIRAAKQHCGTELPF